MRLTNANRHLLKAGDVIVRAGRGKWSGSRALTEMTPERLRNGWLVYNYDVDALNEYHVYSLTEKPEPLTQTCYLNFGILPGKRELLTAGLYDSLEAAKKGAEKRGNIVARVRIDVTEGVFED